MSVDINIDVTPIGHVVVTAREVLSFDRASSIFEADTRGVFIQTSPVLPVQVEYLTGYTVGTRTDL